MPQIITKTRFVCPVCGKRLIHIKPDENEKNHEIRCHMGHFVSRSADINTVWKECKNSCIII